MSDGTDALEVARLEFDGYGLPFPEVPEALVDDLGWVAEQIYSTRPDRPAPYHLAKYVEEVGTQMVADYVLVGRDGRGINSHAMHYYCVQGATALFLQLAWGGVYSEDTPERAAAMAVMYATAEDLRNAAEAARVAGVLAPNERLVVIQSDFYGSRWRRLNGRERLQAFADPAAWQEADDAVLDALKSLLTWTPNPRCSPV